MTKNYKTIALLGILIFTLTAFSIYDIPVLGSLWARFFPKTLDPVSLTVWGLWEEKPILDKVSESYKAEFPHVSINYDDRSVLALVEYKERVFERARDVNGPDIILVHNSWIPRLLASDLLAPAPADVFPAADFSSRYYPVTAKESVVNGSVYAVPAYYEGLALVYNKEHFDEVGQTNPPTAWEELRRLALDLTVRDTSVSSKNVITRGGLALGSASNVDHFSDVLGLLWSQAGVAIPSELDSAAAQEVLKFYVNLVRQDQVWSEDLPEASTAFINGQASMIFVPSWQVQDILDAMPDDSVVGVAPVPQARANNPVTWASYWSYVVPKTSDSTNESWKFINYVSSDAQARFIFSEASKLRPFGTPYAAQTLANEQKTNEFIAPYLQMAPYAASAEISARSGNRRQETALSDAVNAALQYRSSNDLDVSEIMSTVKQTLSQ
ncbi:MAG: extracellular solute-binding protein [Patescibacteria group bacterium]|uniref:Extracellular solute-binding protein n=1 Tax=candidate division WWE3 bacterium TaxID=2053526 RepID=A0A955ECL9_UNCKA|nr:extracellular solute-binding protein [candidate division WWE3 bacterium]